jgi:hypothetical protein
MPPSKDASGGEVHEVAASHEGATGEGLKGGEENDDEESRALERVDNEDSRVETSEDETTTTRPSAPQSTPLEGECTGQTGGGDSESAACEMDHPEGDDGSTNPTRPSRDPADATGDDEHRPDAPTEPPDMPEGTRGRGSWERVETGVSRASREVEGGPGDDDEEHRSLRSDEPPDEPSTETRDRPAVQVEPGGETEAKRNGSIAHGNADAEVDSEVVGAHRDAQVDVESAQTPRDTTSKGERARATAHTRSTTTDEETGQRTETDVDDIPEDPPDPFTPLPMPDQPARPQNEPPSVELEGERRTVASCDVEHNGGKAEASGASYGVEDDGKRPKKLWNTSEPERQRSERRTRTNSPRWARDERHDPGGATDARGDVHSTKEGPRGGTSDRVDETSASCRDTALGAPGGKPVEPRSAESDWSHERIVSGDEHNRVRTRSKDDERVVETSARRDTGPEGHLGDRVESRGVKDDWGRRTVGDSAGRDVIRTMTEENKRDVETDAQCRDPGAGGHSGERIELGDVEADWKR